MGKSPPEGLFPARSKAPSAEEDWRGLSDGATEGSGQQGFSKEDFYTKQVRKRMRKRKWYLGVTCHTHVLLEAVLTTTPFK